MLLQNQALYVEGIKRPVQRAPANMFIHCSAKCHPTTTVHNNNNIMTSSMYCVANCTHCIASIDQSIHHLYVWNEECDGKI